MTTTRDGQATAEGATPHTEALRARVARLEGELAEARRAHDERLQLATALENIYRAVPDLFFQMHADGTIHRYLASPTSGLYVPPEVFLGKRMQDVLPPEPGALFARAFQEASAAREKVHIEYVLQMGDSERWYEARVIPLEGDELVVVVRDMTEQRRDREALRRLNAELERRVQDRTEALEAAAEERLALQQQVIDAQQAALRALSAPLVPIARHAVAVPLIGEIDAARADQLLAVVLAGVQARQASVVLLDVTGVPRVDAAAAEAVARVARAVGLLGAELVLTGVGPEVARALVEIGAELGGVRTARSLEQGIAYAMARAPR